MSKLMEIWDCQKISTISKLSSISRLSKTYQDYQEFRKFWDCEEFQNFSEKISRLPRLSKIIHKNEIVENWFNPISLPTSNIDSVGKNVSIYLMAWKFLLGNLDISEGLEIFDSVEILDSFEIDDIFWQSRQYTRTVSTISYYSTVSTV